ncbi:DUF5825 family protein [Streptomyces alanosinicus]|uniref:Uncharacterized protein n=1 Tax=Streptomyces alanosinicus TaxID=68171 RepID=A0A918YT70_9ACTN|nr:DUF5825 family protein [Streptomyces alanosinicus]GHE14344.1 hypothetical protein GCM10010339_84530 [Streptomyces alanosinicus]
MRDDLLTPPTTATNRSVAGRQVHDLYGRGVRYAELDEPVSLSSPTPRDLHALDFVRVATARGLLVRWQLRAGRRADPALTARDLTHLQPPVSLDGARSAERLSEWWNRFYIGRCVWRRGPGFVQIRDRREGVLQRFNLLQPAYVQAVDLLEQQQVSGVDPDVLAALRAEHLVLDFGGLDWWAPCLIDRWPVPSMVL